MNVVALVSKHVPLLLHGPDAQGEGACVVVVVVVVIITSQFLPVSGKNDGQMQK